MLFRSNPKNEKQIAVGTYSPLPLSLLNDGGQVSAVYTPANSTMKYTDNSNQRGFVSAVEYDTKGNLCS